MKRVVLANCPLIDIVSSSLSLSLSLLSVLWLSIKVEAINTKKKELKY